SLRALFWILFPLSIGILLLHDPLVRLVYHRGAFGEESVRITGQAVLYYAVGLSAFGLSNVLTYAFYSLQDTKTPVIAGLVRLGAKILLSFALVGPMGHGGVALSESLSFLLKACLLLRLLPKELRQLEYRRAFRSFGVTGLITGVMAAVVVVALPYFESAFEIGTSMLMASMALLALMALGTVTYLMFSLLLQPAELLGFYRVVRRGFARL
ncbi:MAG: lipid II flippase MurJ, partial [Candidatus Entotheonellia bacterium]